MRLPIIFIAATLAGCSQTLPEGWSPAAEVTADLAGTRVDGSPRYPAGPPVTVAAPLSCASDFDSRDSYAELRSQAEAIDGISVMDTAFALADFPAAFPGHSGPAVVQDVNGTSVIFIARNISPNEKRAALLHELDHVICGGRH